jgi:hypothetical protein
MTKDKRKKIGKTALKELLKDPQWVVDEHLYETTAYAKDMIQRIYSHSDGRVMIVWGNRIASLAGKAIMHMTRQDYLDFNAELHRLRKAPPQHMLESVQPIGQVFIDSIEDQIANLATLLKLSSDDLDFSFDSLIKLEAKIRHYGFRNTLSSPVFPALLAYVGEIMRRQINGKWRVRVQFNVEEPWLVDAEGRVCQPWSQLIMHLEEGHLSLRDIVEIELKLRRPAPDKFWEAR